jgi:CHAT domain-containing protein
MALRRRTSIAIKQADIAELVADLTRKRERLARIVVQGPGATGSSYRGDLERARTERDTAERALAERSSEFRQEQRQQQSGLADIRAALPPDSAMVSFVRYLQYPFGVSDATSVTNTAVGTPAYLAFVMRSDNSGQPTVLPLGAAQALDDLIATWRKQVTSVAMAGGRSTARAEAALRRTGIQLRAQIWEPIAPHVARATRVFIVPDGPLHLINWNALPGDRGTYLIEHMAPLHYLSAERDLITGDDPQFGHGLLVVDNPVFDQTPALSARVAGAPSPRTVFRGTRSGCADFRSMRFDPLPGSAREADTIAKLWRSSASSAASDTARSLVRLSGREATEDAVKVRAAGTRVLHLATHGFFLGSRCAPAADRVAHNEETSAGHATENPLLIAGFALSGANQREQTGQDEEDGILTAEEIAALDLKGVEWAVLSACDTGVGEVRAGEGVLGLRRAFQIAGARTVIMSLWPVDDDDTRRWMTGVYERRFAHGAGTMEAVRDSSLEQLRRRRRAGLSTHPFYWAGFIAAGEWR